MVMELLLSRVYTSERLSRHVAIRKQIDILVKMRDRLSPFCDELHSRIAAFIDSLSPQDKGSLSFLPKFHLFRSREIPEIWKNYLSSNIPTPDCILIQRAALEHALLILKNKNETAGDFESNVVHKEERRTRLSVEEENAIRYTAGYIVRKIKKRYEEKGPVEVVHCLLSMGEGSELSNDDGADCTFQEYSKMWINLIDRGGLFKVNSEAYSFFLELELAAYPLVRSCIDTGTSCQKELMLKDILADEDVRFAWDLLCVHLNEYRSTQLLSEVTLMWLQIRGFSITSKWMEEYKSAIAANIKGKKPLRRELKELKD
jgi:hypothetical protein